MCVHVLVFVLRARVCVCARVCVSVHAHISCAPVGHGGYPERQNTRLVYSLAVDSRRCAHTTRSSAGSAHATAGYNSVLQLGTSCRYFMFHAMSAVDTCVDS
jgi:hypothetical protein